MRGAGERPPGRWPYPTALIREARTGATSSSPLPMSRSQVPRRGGRSSGLLGAIGPAVVLPSRRREACRDGGTAARTVSDRNRRRGDRVLRSESAHEPATGRRNAEPRGSLGEGGHLGCGHPPALDLRLRCPVFGSAHRCGGGRRGAVGADGFRRRPPTNGPEASVPQVSQQGAPQESRDCLSFAGREQGSAQERQSVAPATNDEAGGDDDCWTARPIECRRGRVVRPWPAGVVGLHACHQPFLQRCHVSGSHQALRC